MVRTKDTASVKVSGAKAPRKAPPATHPTAASSSNSKSSDSKKYSGGNPYCPRETPDWQKPITDFFKTSDQPSTSACDVEQTTIEAENGNNKQIENSDTIGATSSSSSGGCTNKEE